jgi:hypothetical protein
MRARDLFLALWIPDLFMRRVEEDGNWTLMCPNECPGLSDVYDTKDSKKFSELYSKYETENRGKRVVKARDLWGKILEAQIEGGTPYILYKDAANNKSNQKNIGTIKSSNLCIYENAILDIKMDGKEEKIDMKTVVSLVKDGKDLSVKSFDVESNEIVYNRILGGSLTDKSANVIRIEDEGTGKFIICTENHKIFTENRGWVEAGLLKSDDILKIL